MSIQIVPGIRGVVYIALIAFYCALTLPVCGCKRNSAISESNSQEAPSASPPFSTHEPTTYQAVRTITSSETGSSETRISRTKITRDGSMRREEYETKAGDVLVYLEIPTGRFVMLPSFRLIADLREARQTSSVETQPLEEELDLSADRLLNQKVVETRYNRLGPDTVNGRSTTKYRVLPRREASATAANGETLIWVDDTLRIPVRWETRATSGERHSKTVMELTEISLMVDAAIFALPANYRKVNPQALHDRIGGNPQPRNPVAGRN